MAFVGHNPRFTSKHPLGRTGREYSSAVCVQLLAARGITSILRFEQIAE